MTTVGQLLSDAREQKKMSIQEVAGITKIRPKYLRALEDGRYSEFSSDVHLQGFILNYATFLELDVDRIKALYRRERRIKAEPMKSSIFTSKDKPKFTLTPRMVIFPIILLAIAGVVTYFGIQYRKYAEPPFLEVDEPQENSVVADKTLLVSGQVELGSTLTVNNQEVTSVDNLGFFNVYITLPIEGTNKMTIVAENGIGKQTLIERTVVYEPEPEEQLAVTIKSLSEEETVKVTIARDGENIEEKTLDAGGEYTIHAVSEVTLTTSNPEGLQVTVNNKKVNLNEISGEEQTSRTTIRIQGQRIQVR